MNELTHSPPDDASRPLVGARLLLVEDEVLVAMELEEMIGDMGAEVVGPFGRLTDALNAIRQEAVDGAVLDIHLDGGTTLRLVDVLVERGRPVLFVTASAPGSIPENYRHVPRLKKPFDPAEFTSLARSAFGRR